jgi:hypothetical protein
MKLTVFDAGDPSIGIFATQWDIECPFDKDEASEEELTSWKQDITELYIGYCEGRLTAMYDFEIEAENKLYEGEENQTIIKS